MVKETNEMMTSPFNKNAVLEKLDQVSTTFESFLSTHKELVELVENSDHQMDAAEEDKYFDRIDQQIFQLKHVAHNWLRSIEGQAFIRPPSTGSGRSKKTHRSSSTTSSKSMAEMAIAEKIK